MGSLKVNSQATSKGDDLERWVCFVTVSQDKSWLYGRWLTWPGSVSTSITHSFFTWLWTGYFISPSASVSPPPRRKWSYSLNRRMRVSSQDSAGVTSSASWNGASPTPVGYDPKDPQQNYAFSASLRIQDFVVSSCLHVSSGSGHSWLPFRTALNYTKL